MSWIGPFWALSLGFWVLIPSFTMPWVPAQLSLGWLLGECWEWLEFGNFYPRVELFLSRCDFLALVWFLLFSKGIFREKRHGIHRRCGMNNGIPPQNRHEAPKSGIFSLQGKTKSSWRGKNEVGLSLVSSRLGFKEHPAGIWPRIPTEWSNFMDLGTSDKRETLGLAFPKKTHPGILCFIIPRCHQELPGSIQQEKLPAPRFSLLHPADL